MMQQISTSIIDLLSLQEKDADPQKDQLTFPTINAGVAGQFADAYSEISEAPHHFYLLVFLACLGSILAPIVTIKSLLKVCSRLYMILLGPSGRGRKSTPMSHTTDFLKSVTPRFSMMHNVNSGEGLAVFLEKNPSTLLVFDEFATFVAKATQKNNTLLGAVTSFFEQNTYQTATKDKQLVIENAHLSLLAACTTDTWEKCWVSDFTAIGLVNRLFLVPGIMEKLVSIPPRLPISKWKLLRETTLSVIHIAEFVKEYDLTGEARDLYDTWYRHVLDHKSVHSVRLDTYALRLMLLLAVARGDEAIDCEVVRDSIKIANWQYRVRQQYDPIDADNEMAKVEQRIRRALANGPKNRRDLQRMTNSHRSGLWIWKNALHNLMGNGEINYNTKSTEYSINVLSSNLSS